MSHKSKSNILKSWVQNQFVDHFFAHLLKDNKWVKQIRVCPFMGRLNDLQSLHAWSNCSRENAVFCLITDGDEANLC